MSRADGHVVRSLRLVATAAPGVAGQLVALTLVAGLLPVARAWLSKAVVDGIAASLGATGASGSGGVLGVSGDPAAGGGGVVVLALALLLVVAGSAAGALEPVERTLTQRLTDHSVAAVDRELIRAAGRLVDLHRIEHPAFGDALRRVDLATYPLTGALRAGSLLAGALLGLAGLLALLGSLHPLLPIVLAVLMVPHLFVRRRLENQVYEYLGDHSRAAREMDYCLHLTMDPVAAKELRVFGTGDYFLRRFEDLRDRALREASGVRLRLLGLSLALVVIDAAALAGGLWYTGWQAAAGRLTAGDVALYVTAVLQAERLLDRVPFGLGTLHGLHRHGGAFFGFLAAARPAIRLPARGAGRPAPGRLAAGVELHQVTFSYPHGAGQVLQDVSLVIPAGKVTALVGANGAGKSTLVKLLTRLHDPTTGQIALDGAPLWEYDLADLRSRIGVVYQDFAQFSLTLRENVAVGAGIRCQDDVAGVAVERAAAWSGADEVAASLPHGYETDLTRYLAGGVELSGGQWQKVALARGAVREVALLVLDEPTSALDADAEHRLLERFGELAKRCTTLLISHRLSTVRLADHIVVLEGGRVIEQGSHDELHAAGGTYARLYRLQAGYYQ